MISLPPNYSWGRERRDIFVPIHALDLCLEIWKVHKNFKAKAQKWQRERLIRPFPPFLLCKCLHASPVSDFGGLFTLSNAKIFCLIFFFFLRHQKEERGQNQTSVLLLLEKKNRFTDFTYIHHKQFMQPHNAVPDPESTPVVTAGGSRAS